MRPPRPLRWEAPVAELREKNRRASIEGVISRGAPAVCPRGSTGLCSSGSWLRSGFSGARESGLNSWISFRNLAEEKGSKCGPRKAPQAPLAAIFPSHPSRAPFRKPSRTSSPQSRPARRTEFAQRHLGRDELIDACLGSSAPQGAEARVFEPLVRSEPRLRNFGLLLCRQLVQFGQILRHRPNITRVGQRHRSRAEAVCSRSWISNVHAASIRGSAFPRRQADFSSSFPPKNRGLPHV